VVHHSYFAVILDGAGEALYEQDMRMVLCPTHHEHDRDVSLLDRPDPPTAIFAFNDMSLTICRWSALTTRSRPRSCRGR
jgi:DNA-binding LacI/PurR family transcriptional regulator